MVITDEEMAIMQTLGAIADMCPECKKDKDIFCPRNVDGQCLECGVNLCAGHLMEHFKKVHCMALDFEHCSNK